MSDSLGKTVTNSTNVRPALTTVPSAGSMVIERTDAANAHDVSLAGSKSNSLYAAETAEQGLTARSAGSQQNMRSASAASDDVERKSQVNIMYIFASLCM
jgi:hypothetical protein